MYPQFDRSRLRLRPLAERQHDLDLSVLLPLDAVSDFEHPDLSLVAERIVQARADGAARILMMGAHVIRSGVARHIIDLMHRGYIDHIAMNGAGPIHDWELALVGATTESVARYIRSGEFGLWQETGRINDAIIEGDRLGLGLGEAVGKAIHEGDFPHKDVSILAAGYALRIPVTVHVGIGYDIIHEHPNCDGASLGAASYRDFLIFAETVRRLEGGVLLSFGSAVMAPEVFLKALAMARNVAHQDGRRIARFTTAVFDLVPLEGDLTREAERSDPRYYFRPWKTLLARTVAGGGESFYFCGSHRDTIPALYRQVLSVR